MAGLWIEVLRFFFVHVRNYVVLHSVRRSRDIGGFLRRRRRWKLLGGLYCSGAVAAYDEKEDDASGT